MSWTMNPFEKTEKDVVNQSKIQVYTTELVMPEVFAFPWEQRSISRLALFSDEPALPKIEPREALPLDDT